MMASNREEAVRAKALAEKQFMEKNFQGAKHYALKAQTLCPELEGISQMVVTFGIYSVTEARINGELDFYSILGVDPSVDKSKLKKQYKKLAVLLHPDKNRTVGADGAFRLISEAWTLLSDISKRNSYDQRRNWLVAHGAGTGGYEDCYKFSSSHGRLDTFWTVCTSCHVQYEYLRKYVNKRLSCKNCRGVFVAVETGLAPYSNYSHAPENGIGSHNYGFTYMPTSTGYCTPNGASGHHPGSRSESVSNISFQGNSSRHSAGIVDPNSLSKSSFAFCQPSVEAKKTKANGCHQTVKAKDHAVSNGNIGVSEVSNPRRGRPAKKRKVEVGTSHSAGKEEISPIIVGEQRIVHGNVTSRVASKLLSPSETSAKRYFTVSACDSRHLLIDKARSEILRKLGEMKLASEAAAAESEKRNALHNKQPELKRTVSMSITVPDSDFHDFDRDRSEECFRPRQIWALYDEEDGMPRLYCVVREVISLQPFKVHISYLSSKSDSEFGSVHWLDCGFTKSCGSFRAIHSEMVEHVNIFSHLLSGEKAGRGGRVRIYPKSGEIWAVYRNWSSDWNRTTPENVRHQYEMVEVLDDYSEEYGVWVAPLLKLEGFKTVYQSDKNSAATRLIPRREMLRFSHQVPSCSLKIEGTNLPEGCWDLDPAATPDELLQGETDVQNNTAPVQKNKAAETKGEHCHADGRLPSSVRSIRNDECASEAEARRNLIDDLFAPSPEKGPHVTGRV